MESIITIATVLTMYFNAANDVNSQYLYNSDLEDGVIHKIEVYEQKAEGQMCAKMVDVLAAYPLPACTCSCYHVDGVPHCPSYMLRRSS